MSELLETYGRELRLVGELLGILLGCIVAYVVTRQVIIRVVERLVRKTPTDWDDVLLDKGVFRRLAWIAPALVLFYSAYRLEDPELQEVLQRFVVIYIILLVVLVLSRTLSAVSEIYQRTERAKSFPIKGYIQVVQIVISAIGIIVLISTVLDQSPWGILSGLGAATAVLLLVFRDTILSFVASVQLTTNDIVRVGDWISMPQYGADGDVVDIALYTVKVQNWDKTISTIPTAKLMQESFRNWRGMSESGGRRIARAVNLDMRSIRFLEPVDVESLSKVALLRDYLPARLEEIRTWNEANAVDPKSPINGRRLTNIGTLRAYLVAYLRAHPMIHKDMTFLVRQLAPTSEGLPLQIYVFSKDQVWANYEAIQADIFDHVLAALPAFDLRVFQQPTGHDFSALRVSE
ncbi:MAG: mechanosensitive ion channel domain-containing protein [Myxococcota bacterium]